jgi:hypothetical protein
MVTNITGREMLFSRFKDFSNSKNEKNVPLRNISSSAGLFPILTSSNFT